MALSCRRTSSFHWKMMLVGFVSISILFSYNLLLLDGGGTRVGMPLNTITNSQTIQNKTNVEIHSPPIHQEQDAQSNTQLQHEHQQKKPLSPTSVPTSNHFPFHHIGGRYKHSSSSIFKNASGYHPTGGKLPHDNADFLYDRRSWKYVDNQTCLLNDDPTLSESSYPLAWQYRAPYALLLGTMKGGTHAVIESLWEHPWVVPTKHWENHFFEYSTKAIRTERGMHRTKTLANYATTIQQSIRNTGNNATSHDDEYESDPRSMAQASSSSELQRRIPKALQDPNRVLIQSSPRYLVNSDRIPDFILCICPWVKLLAILRNPIERVASHYRFLDESRRADNLSMVDWKVWIEDDLRLLQEAGVFNATTPKEEKLAWKTYQRRPNSHYIVGRGLYVIQLEQYLEAMDRVGKPRRDLYVMQSELFVQQRQHEYDQLLDFLDLPIHNLSNPSERIHVTATGYESTNKSSYTSLKMPFSIRKQLEQLYQPYNQRLYRLLDWEEVWD